MTDPKRRGPWLGVGFGGLMSLLAFPGIGSTGACIIPDNCIAFPLPTVNVCKRFANAVDLNSGLPLLDETGTVPEGCICVEQADAHLLVGEDADTDAPAFELLEAELDGEARTACAQVAIANGLGVDETNCMSVDEVLGPLQETGAGACESRFCSFAPEPTFGSCPPDGSPCPGVSAPVGTDGPMDEKGSTGPATNSSTSQGVDSTGEE